MSRILIVEDHLANAKFARTVLVADGHEVIHAPDAEVGLTLAREQAPTLILMDIQLPGIDGVTATRMLKADPATADIPVIAVTAHAMAGDEERILAAGCMAYLSKPIDYKVLLKLVARATGDGPPRGKDE